MPFSIRPYHRFPVHCSVTYNAGPFLKLPLAYLFGFGLLITLLLLSSGPAYAEWVAIEGETAGGITVYVDSDSIRRKGDRVKMWHLEDFDTVKIIAGNADLSLEIQDEYDCVGEQIRNIAYTFYSGHMGGGEPVSGNSSGGKWEPVAPGSVGQALWKVACNKQ